MALSNKLPRKGEAPDTEVSYLVGAFSLNGYKHMCRSDLLYQTNILRLSCIGLSEEGFINQLIWDFSFMT